MTLIECIRLVEEERPDLFVFAPCGNIQPLQVIIEVNTNQGPLVAVCWVPDTMIERVALYEGDTKLGSFVLETNVDEMNHMLKLKGYGSFEVSHFYKTTKDFIYEI